MNTFNLREYLPTIEREKIVTYIEKQIARLTSEKHSCEQAFIFTLDEKQRATALQVMGELKVYNEFLKQFKGGKHE